MIHSIVRDAFIILRRCNEIPRVYDTSRITLKRFCYAQVECARMYCVAALQERQDARKRSTLIITVSYDFEFAAYRAER